MSLGRKPKYYDDGKEVDDCNLNLWRTPSATEIERGIGKKSLEEKKANNIQITLSAQVQRWPTPTSRDYKGGRKPETLERAGRTENNSLPDKIQRFPTPIAGDWKGQVRKDGTSTMLSGVEITGAGKLNPDWVEWLMGFPVGWTDLGTDELKEFSINEEPNIKRVTNKTKGRAKRIKCLGNAVVPQVAEVFGKAIIQKMIEEAKND